MYRTTKKRKIGRYIVLFLVALLVGRRVLFRKPAEDFDMREERKASNPVAEVNIPRETDSLADFEEVLDLFPRVREVFVEKRGDTLLLTRDRKVNLGEGQLMRKLALLDTILSLDTSFRSLDFKFKNLVIMR